MPLYGLLAAILALVVNAVVPALLQGSILVFFFGLLSWAGAIVALVLGFGVLVMAVSPLIRIALLFAYR